MVWPCCIWNSPVCSVYYAFYRPKPTWSWKDCMGVYVIHQLMQAIGDYRIPFGSRPPTEGVAESSLRETSFAWIPGVPDELVKGVARSDTVKPLPRVVGYVWPKGKDLSKSKNKVVLYMHGGGYHMFSGHESDPVSSNLPRALVKYGNIDGVLVTEYRDYNYGIWPAPLLDALSGYYHLVKTCNIPPENIVLLGDSASAHLMNCLIRYLRDEQVLPLPGKLVSISPWTYQSLSKPNSHVDFLNYDYVAYGAQMMDRGHAPIEYSSPCHPAFPPTADIFASWPPTYLLFGDSEVLCEDGWEMDRRMRLAGVDVTTVCERDGVHDMLACTWFSTKERHAAIWAKISQWIDS